MTNRFDIDFENLPSDLPIFPLSRVILLPRVNLPLNIFEPRYLAMVDHAMSTNRMIGMIQSRSGGAVFKTGCAGRIISFNETEDGRYLITLKGVCRFDVASEGAPATGGFRHVTPDWAPYRHDLQEEETPDICRERLMHALDNYFRQMGMFCDKWSEMRQMNCDRLVSTLSVICPFDSAEKQSLLEAKTLHDRIQALQAVLDIALARACKSAEEGLQTTCH